MIETAGDGDVSNNDNKEGSDFSSNVGPSQNNSCLGSCDCDLGVAGGGRGCFSSACCGPLSALHLASTK